MNRSKLNKRIAPRKKHFGQGMTEYVVIVGLVGIAAIGVFSAFGHVIQDQVAGFTNALAGNSSGAQTQQTDATNEATAATTDAGIMEGLDSILKNIKDQ